MHGLISLLDQTHETLVHQIWQDLEESCGTAGVLVTPFPHFSWLVASDFDWSALEKALLEISENVLPFTVRTTGLAMFTGESPILYIPVVRTSELSRTHEMLWNKIKPLGMGVSPLYSPEFWMPHITLGFGDVTSENLPCLMQMLSSRSFSWEIKIDNISIGFQNDGTTAVISNRYEFKS